MAISAAWHAPAGVDYGAGAVEWGVVPAAAGDGDGGGRRHCSLSSGEVEEPVVGEVYG